MAADRQEIGKPEGVGQQNRRSLLNHKDISTGAHFAHTRRAASSVNSLILLAPQVGFEPTTLRLTAERLIAASRCKHKTSGRQNAIFAEIGGTLGGAQGSPMRRTRSRKRGSERTPSKQGSTLSQHKA